MKLTSETTAFLERCVWPKVLSQSDKEIAYSALVEQDYPAGALVCERQELAKSWIGVVDGFLRVQDTTANGRHVMFTGVARGGWIGEGSLLKIEKRKYEIVATRATRTVQLPRSTFLALLDRSIAFNHFLLDHLNERLSQFIATMKFDRLLEPTPRVARGIASLYHPVLYPNTEPTLRVSQEELAWMVGVSRQRVNIAMRQLEDEGIVKNGYSSITVIDLQKLSQYE